MGAAASGGAAGPGRRTRLLFDPMPRAGYTVPRLVKIKVGPDNRHEACFKDFKLQLGSRESLSCQLLNSTWRIRKGTKHLALAFWQWQSDLERFVRLEPLEISKDLMGWIRKVWQAKWKSIVVFAVLIVLWF